ncbi:MAG: hypothetical protein QHH74_01165 [Spirochaetota bacterium]|nr:hypothetical protein [Spirochaetota bacterium]
MNNNTQNTIAQLKEELIPLIKTVVQDEVKSNIEDFMRQSELRAKELSLIERIIRVEEEIKALKEIEKARFEAMETRFEAMETRFEAIEKRFSSLQWFMGIGFTITSILIAIFGLLK